MIRIKDEYKQMNKQLLAEHKASVICLKCEQLKEELALSELAVSNLKEKNEAFKTSSSELQTLIPLLENQLREVNEATKEKEKCLLEKLIGTILMEMSHTHSDSMYSLSACRDGKESLRTRDPM